MEALSPKTMRSAAMLRSLCHRPGEVLVGRFQEVAQAHVEVFGAHVSLGARPHETFHVACQASMPEQQSWPSAVGVTRGERGLALASWSPRADPSAILHHGVSARG